MENLPSIDAIESRHSFPGRYIFKVIGSAEDGFVGRAVVAVRKALGLEDDPRFEMRQTRSGRHIAITFEPEVDSAEQVLTVYRELLGLSGIVMIL